MERSMERIYLLVDPVLWVSKGRKSRRCISDMGIPALISARGAPSYGWLSIRLQWCPSLKACVAGVRKRGGREKHVRGRREEGLSHKLPGIFLT